MSSSASLQRKKGSGLLRPLLLVCMRALSLALHVTELTGNIATGNLSEFLPNILYIVESDPSKRLLSLYAVKEVSGSVYNDCI